MSDHIPFEIQSEIMKSLLVKSVIKFRSVSKQWKSLIDSSEYIAGYNLHHTQLQQHQQHLLASYVELDDVERKYVSIVDDDTFPRHKLSLTVPFPVKQLNEETTITVGSSQGLVCLYTPSNEVVLWNPSIRKSVVIIVTNVTDYPSETVFGFGVCPHTNDPKFVKITSSCNHWQGSRGIFRYLEVFTLSSGRVWRSLKTNLPRESILFKSYGLLIDGFINFLASDNITGDAEFNLIMSFDVTSEEFTEMYLPDCLAHDHEKKLSISKLRETLIVLEYNYRDEEPLYGVWTVMKSDVPKSFTKLYTINTPEAFIGKVHGFRKRGEPIVSLLTSYVHDALFVYEPCSQNVDYIGISGKESTFIVSSYVETLFLLDLKEFKFFPTKVETQRY